MPLICHGQRRPQDASAWPTSAPTTTQAGRAAGKLVKEALGEAGGTVVIFVGTLDSLNARQRRQGVIDELAGRKAPPTPTDFETSPDGETYGKYKLYSKTYLDQPEGGQEAPRRTPRTPSTKIRPKPTSAWSACGPTTRRRSCTAVADSRTQARRKRIKIVGFDEDAETLDGIKDGTIYATVVQDPFGFGYEAVKMMAALARGDKSGLPKDGIKHIPYRIIAKEAGEVNGEKRLGVEAFSEELDKLLGK